MLMSTVGFRNENGCSGDAQEKLKTTGAISCQRGRPHQQTATEVKIIKGEKLVEVPRPRQTG
jgi:hypothetical protein